MAHLPTAVVPCRAMSPIYLLDRRGHPIPADQRDDHLPRHLRASQRWRSTAAAKAWARAVVERDGECARCHATTNLQADHVVPPSEGGAMLAMSNGQTLCAGCNRDKSDVGGGEEIRG